MTNAYSHQLSLESYAQESFAGTWMEIVDGPDPFPDFLQDSSLSHRDDNLVNDRQIFKDDCSECNGQAPPIFNLPPPPPLPIYEEDGETSMETAHLIYDGEKFKDDNVATGRKDAVNWGPSSVTNKNCDESLLPQNICPAFLIAGNHHVPSRLQPSIAALIVAATTFAFVITVAAIVCWRYRRHKNRGGSSKSTTDLANGVIYEDLPSGPTPRGLAPVGHDTRTLAPMELLDLKLANQLQNSSFALPDSIQKGLMNPYSTSSTISPSNVMYPKFPNVSYNQDSSVSKDFSLYENSQNTYNIDYAFRPNVDDPVFKEYLYCPSGHNIPIVSAKGEFLYTNQDYPNSHKMLATNPYSPDSQNILVTDSNIYYTGSENSRRGIKGENSRNSYLNRFQDMLIESDPPKKTSFKGSQDIYNPTYEEISTGSECTSVTSGTGSSAGRGSATASPHGPGDPLLLRDGLWTAVVPCPCGTNKRGGSTVGRKLKRGGRRHKTLPEKKDYHEALIEPLAPLPIPPATLYTIPSTSDGRTSTSSSSDLPPDRSCVTREPRYYVGSPKDECHPYLVTNQMCVKNRPHDQCGPRESPLAVPCKDQLPPLPSRSDKYRIFFTTDRRRTYSGQEPRTLDLASRKRHRDRDQRSSVESEPLYNE